MICLEDGHNHLDVSSAKNLCNKAYKTLWDAFDNSNRIPTFYYQVKRT